MLYELNKSNFIALFNENIKKEKHGFSNLGLEKLYDYLVKLHYHSLIVDFNTINKKYTEWYSLEKFLRYNDISEKIKSPKDLTSYGFNVIIVDEDSFIVEEE